MFYLRLKKGLSYCGAVKATRSNPDVFTENKATADEAVATGYFRLVSSEETPEPLAEPELGKTLDEMTVAELETYAAYKGVELKGISKKADIITKLKEELEAEENEGAVDYGSPTMQELQEQK